MTKILTIISSMLALALMLNVNTANSIGIITKDILESEKKINRINGKKICAQVITFAVSPDGKKCESFKTPCDVPNSWNTVKKCGGKEIEQMIPNQDEGLKDRTEKIEKLNKIKNKYKESLSNYKKAKKGFLNLRSRDNLNGFLAAIVKVMIKHSEFIKNRIENMRFISEEQKLEVTTKIEKNIDELNKELENTKNLKTIEEQKTFASKIRGKWKNIRILSRIIIAEIFYEKVNVFISKIESFYFHLENKINNVEYKNSKISEIMNEVKDNIELAKKQNMLVKKKIKEMKNTKNEKGSFLEIIKITKQSQEYLKSAHISLINLAYEARN